MDAAVGLHTSLKGSSAEELRQRLVVRSRWDAVGAPSATEGTEIAARLKARRLLPAEFTWCVAHDPQSGREGPKRAPRETKQAPRAANTTPQRPRAARRAQRAVRMQADKHRTAVPMAELLYHDVWYAARLLGHVSLHIHTFGE